MESVANEAVQMVMENKTIEQKILKPLKKRVYPIVICNIVFNFLLLCILMYIAYRLRVISLP